MWKDKYIIEALRKHWKNTGRTTCSFYLGYYNDISSNTSPNDSMAGIIRNNYIYFEEDTVEKCVEYILQNRNNSTSINKIYLQLIRTINPLMYECAYIARLGEFNEMVNKMDNNVTESNS